jgi:hypothetical protein
MSNAPSRYRGLAGSNRLKPRVGQAFGRCAVIRVECEPDFSPSDFKYQITQL